MCNGWNHSPGCECGFGPPYPNVISVGEARDWTEEILDEPWLARQGLSELNWHKQSIEEFIAAYTNLISSGVSRGNVIRELKELLGRRRIIEEEVWTEIVRVPLYRFGAPRVPGATVAYSEGESQSRSGYWDLKIFGIGTGHSRELTYASSNTYVCSHGACKQVFVPVRLRVARVRVEEGGTVQGRGVRAEVIVPKAKEKSFVRGRGCQDLPRASCAAAEEQPDEELFYDFSADSGKELHRVAKTWEMDVAREVSLRLKRIADIGPVARVKHIRLLGLDISLPSGHYYLGFRTNGRRWGEKP